MSFILMSSFIYGSLFAWIVQAPFYFETIFHLSDFSYALYAALGPVVYIMGSFVNYILLPRLGILMLLRFGLGLSLMGCLALLCATLQSTPHLWWYMAAFLIFNAGVSFVFANASAKAVDLALDKRGTASALLVSCEQLFAAFSSSIVGIYGPLTLTPAVMVMLCSVIGAVIMYRRAKLNTSG
jgi:DHA1 family bicyclomycin/chloramphenicol resistance-like MFS transporter